MPQTLELEWRYAPEDARDSRTVFRREPLQGRCGYQFTTSNVVKYFAPTGGPPLVGTWSVEKRCHLRIRIGNAVEVLEVMQLDAERMIVNATDRTRQRSILAVVALLVVAEIVLTILCYLLPRGPVAPILAVAGIGVLALVDVAARRSPPRPPWYRPWFRAALPYWCLVPFLCALAGSVFVHYQTREESLTDVHELASDLAVAVPALARPKTVLHWQDPAWLLELRAAWGVGDDIATRVATEDVNAAVRALVTSRFATPADQDKDEVLRFAELARAVGHDLLRSHGMPREVYDRADRDTITGFALTITVQALFILWVPILLVIALAKANRRGSRRATHEVRKSLDLRDRRILAEDRYLFLPRLCFGVLLILGTNYVFSPFGLRATYLMSILDEHVLPGQTSWTLWSTSFDHVPVLVVGFVGFLLYALVTATQRFVLDDLDDQAILSLFVRGLIVILLSLALSGSPMDATIDRIFVFLAGIFPVRAIEALANRAKIAIDPGFTNGDPSFAGLPSLDSSKVFALRAAGIESSYDLAVIPIEEIAATVRIDPRLLGRAVDRAILLEAVGLDLAKLLEPFGITSATELAACAGNMPEPIAHAFGANDVAAQRVAQRLTQDPRVDTVKKWLMRSPGMATETSGSNP